ncbi:hypothetical protein J14TS2_44090 [Bacillus sp. J14TS2]|nr:hypothetical protein J14TS2_44090 [Bacillus sp. J14TS2]
MRRIGGTNADEATGRRGFSFSSYIKASCVFVPVKETIKLTLVDKL